MIKLMNVKNLDEYYKSLKTGVNFSTMWYTLQTKSEYKSSKSEKGYQIIAVSMASSIASELNLNADLAEVLSVCKGAFFPVKGKEGKKCILEYMKEHNIQMSESDLARNFVEYELYHNGEIITPEFDKLLKELFDEQNEPHTPEVQIARICYESVEGIKRIEKYSKTNVSDLLYKLSNDIENECIQAGKPIRSKKLEELLKSIPNEEEKISNEDKQRIFNELDEFMEYYKNDDTMKGIYEYIGTVDLEER